MMKKYYISPNVNMLKVKSEVILQGSIFIDKEGSGAEQLSNKRQGAWGNVWEK